MERSDQGSAPCLSYAEKPSIGYLTTMEESTLFLLRTFRLGFRSYKGSRNKMYDDTSIEELTRC